MKRINQQLITRFGIKVLVLLAFGITCQGQTGMTKGMPDNKRISPYLYPLKSGGTGNRYLVDQNNQPFFWSGEAAWSLIAQLSKQDVGFYLDNRKEKGFTVIMVSLIEHKFCNNPPANFYGELPFTDNLFVSPNEKYFAHADYVIKSAAQRNIVVLLAPLTSNEPSGTIGQSTNRSCLMTASS